MKQQYNKMIIAHRGASGLVRFENTKEAFEKAIEVKADSIECDVRRTKDNIIIINHDADIDGMVISENTYDDLCKKTNILGYNLLTLNEAVNIVKGRIGIDIEIKEEGYEQEIYNVVISTLNTDEFYIRSFYDESIKKIKEIDKSVTTILLLGCPSPRPYFITRYTEVFPWGRIKKCKCDCVSPYYKILILNYTKRMHRKNIRVIPWTVNTTDDMIKCLYTKGCDAIVTNYPNEAYTLIKSRCFHYNYKNR